jgi:acetyl-CoA carboxylase biotin carboxyl carrier protein
MAAKRSKSKKSKTTKKPAARKKAAPKAPAKKKAAAKAKAAPKAKARRSSKSDDRLTQLERLVEMMVARDVVEVELEEAGARWRVRRTEPQAVAYAAAPAVAMPAAAGAAPAAASPAAAAAPAAEPQGEVFKSPMLGTYYQAASPDAEAFVKVGDRVNADTTLCIVEAMKVMNEIQAEREFEILEILVKNGEPVEFGQPMFLIR